MKQFEIVKLKESIVDFKIDKACVAVLLKSDDKFAEIICFNSVNMGEFTIVKVNKEILESTNQFLPNNVKIELETLIKEDKKNIKFPEATFKECDNVKLITNKPQYQKYNIFEGVTGVVAINYSIKNKVLVEFTQIAEDGKMNCVCIPVDSTDLVKIN